MQLTSPGSSSDLAWTVGSWIAARRRYLTLTQDQLAERVGTALEQQSDGKIKGESCSTRTIRYAEAEKPLSVRIARGLAQALDIPPEQRANYTNWFCRQPRAPSWRPCDPRQNITVSEPVQACPAPPPERTASMAPPPAAGFFIDRAAELGRLHTMLNTPACVMITSRAGAGKLTHANAPSGAGGAEEILIRVRISDFACAQTKSLIIRQRAVLVIPTPTSDSGGAAGCGRLGARVTIVIEPQLIAGA